MSFSSDPALQANQLPISVEFAKDQEKFIEQLTLLYKRIANATNTKEGALYNLAEVATFQSYFTAGDPQKFRPTYRRVVNFGALPNATTKSVAHGISFASGFRLTRMYGAATDPTGLNYLPLPYASPTDANNIELNADGTNVNIITGSDRTAFTACTIVIEYTKY